MPPPPRPMPRTGTAIHGYDRLEAPGLWRPGWEEPRRDVVVSLGEATLTLTDRDERPLAHWSLPAVRRVGHDPPLYAPADAEGAGDPDGETLQVDDAQMNEALDAILASLAPDQAGGRVRWGAGLAALALALGLALWAGPGLLRSQAASGLAPAERAALGERLVRQMARGAGRPCEDAFGAAALRTLAARALGDPPPRVWVLPDGPEGGSASVPGGIVVSAAAVAAAGAPEELAARLAAEAARPGDPLAALIAEARIGELARMMVAPDVPDAVIRRHAATLLEARAPPPADGVAAADLSEADWAALRDVCARG